MAAPLKCLFTLPAVTVDKRFRVEDEGGGMIQYSTIEGESICNSNKRVARGQMST